MEQLITNLTSYLIIDAFFSVLVFLAVYFNKSLQDRIRYNLMDFLGVHASRRETAALFQSVTSRLNKEIRNRQILKGRVERLSNPYSTSRRVVR